MHGLVVEGPYGRAAQAQGDCLQQQILPCVVRLGMDVAGSPLAVFLHHPARIDTFSNIWKFCVSSVASAA